MCSGKLGKWLQNWQSSFHFLGDKDLNGKWIYFVNRKNWLLNVERKNLS